MSEPVFVAITRDNEPLMILQFMREGRSPTLPIGALWDERRPGWWTREPTQQAIISEVYKACSGYLAGGVQVAQPVKFRIIDKADIPTDRTYRNAYMDTDSAIEHDMGIARDIHRDRLRLARESVLQALDVDFLKAIEIGDIAAQAEITQQKQELRDVTEMPEIDSAKTIEELKAAWPASLELK